MPPVLAWTENKSSERLEQLGYGDTCRILNYYERLSEISESVKDVSVQSIHHLLSALIKVTRPSVFWGVPSYFEARWYPHLYFYRKSNT